MAGKGKEEEYQHQDEDYGAGVEQPMTEPQVVSRAGGASKFLNKRLLIIVGLGIAILVVYQFFLSGNKQEDNVPQQMAASETSSTPAIKPTIKKESALKVPTLKTQATQPIVKPKIEMSRTFDRQEINRLASTSSQNQIALQQLQQNQARVDRSLAGIERQLSSLSNQLSTLASTKQVTKKTRPKATRQRSTARQAAAPARAFYLKAIAPGSPPRAWLSYEKGLKSVTVVEGDRLRGYGKIESIDPALGYVTTSSGRKIGYHPQDS